MHAPSPPPSPAKGKGRHRIARRIALGAAFGSCTVLFAGSASALEWYVEPAVTLGYEHHDNILLTTLPHDDVSGFSAAARADLGVRAATWDIHAQLGGKSSWFDDEAFDRDDYHLKLFSSLAGQRTMWQLDGARLQESLLTSETIDPDTGLPLTQRNRWTETVSPAVTYSIDATTQVRLRLNDAHITYEEGGVNNLFDYRSQSAEITVSKQWSPRTTFSATIVGSQFEAPENRDLQSKTTSAYVGASHRFTPLLRVGLSAGAWRNEVEFTDCVESFFIFCLRFDRVDSTDTGNLLQADAEWKFARSRLSGKLGRDVRPSGSGTEVEFDQAGALYEYQIRPSRIWAILSADATRTRSLSEDTTAIDRDYYQIAPRLRYRALRSLDLEVSYRHTRQKYETAEDAATDKAVYLTLTYRPPRMTRSR